MLIRITGYSRISIHTGRYIMDFRPFDLFMILPKLISQSKKDFPENMISAALGF